MAGALAAAAMLFKSSDPAYAAALVDGATRAYAFAQNSNKVKCGAWAQAAPGERASALCGTTCLSWLGVRGMTVCLAGWLMHHTLRVRLA